MTACPKRLEAESRRQSSDLFYEEGLLITPNGEGANIQVWDPAMYDGPVAA